MAEDLAQQAFDAYSRNEFLAAVALYKKAYQTSSAGVILFNIANIYDKKLKDKELALEYYRRYLRSGDTEPDLVKRASERLDVVRAEIEAAKQATNDDDRSPRTTVPSPSTAAAAMVSTTPAKEPPKPPEPKRTTAAYIGLGVAGLGVAGLAAGTLYGLKARSKNDDADRVCMQQNACVDPQGVQLTEDARAAARTSTLTFAIGGVLVVGGVGLFIYAPKKEEQMGRISLRITPQLGGLAVSGEWR